MLVGRESECVRVEGLLLAAREGQGGTILVRGEPGVGKTALLRFAIQAATGFTVLAATGVEAEASRVYGGASDLVEPLRNQVEQLPAQQAEALTSALGSSKGAVAPATVAAAIFALVVGASRARPIAVVVDDLFWLDDASREVVLFLARRSDLGGFAVLLAAREAEPPWLKLKGVDEIRLGGFSPPEAAALIESKTSREPTRAVVRRLVAETGGNPLALGELARLLTPAELSGAEPLRSPLPAGETVEALFASLVEGLDAGARWAVLAAAASERRDLVVLAEAASRLGANPAAFERAEAAGLVELGAGEVRFRHPLVRAVAYQRADAAERRAAHRALASIDPDPERRARHLAEAATGPDESVAAELEQAAGNARRRGALTAAATSLMLASRLSPGRDEAVRRWLAAAQASQRAGQADAALRAADEVLAGTDDVTLQSDAVYVKSRVLDVRGHPEEAALLLETQAERVQATDRSRSLYLLSQAIGYWFHAIELGHALAAARRCQELDPLGELGDTLLRVSIGNALSHMGCAAEARPLQEQAAAEVEALDDLIVEPSLGGPAATALMHLERNDRARALLARQVEQSRRAGALSVLVHALMLSTSVEVNAGEWPAAAIFAEETARLAADLGQPMTELWGHVMRAWVAAVQGDEVEREARFALAIDLAESAGLRRAVECNVAEARGQALIARREYELAASTLALLDGLDTAGGASPLARWLPDLAEALLRAGRLDEARERIAQLEKVHADSRQKWAQAAAARLHGLIEDEFEGSFERALELGSTAYKPFELARTALYYGERLRRAGERRRARARLADALATFSRLGARPWASRAEAELRASGQTRAPQRSYGSLLTPSEQQVAALVADGLSNREIAERLFVSVRTVEMHISNAYRKLGIRSRTGLARYVLTDPAPAEHEPISTH